MLSYRSAAKINLYLSVDGNLPRGYHQLTTVMQSVSLFDILHFDFQQRHFSLSVPGFDLGATADNIVSRVWRRMKEEFSLPGEVKIRLEKKIPVAAGLAGGSGNGAATLHAVNDYFQLNLRPCQLADIGSEIGADIPFCVSGGTALARGKGEKLQRLDPLPPFPILLLKSDFALSTAAVFQAFDDLRPETKPDCAAFLRALQSKDSQALMNALYNDLERVTLQKYGQIAQQKEALQKAGFAALMSGSGPSVFALCPLGGAEKGARFLAKFGGEGFLLYPTTQSIYPLSDISNE